jgi:hypothetical protein
MRINLAHLRDQGIDFAVFDAVVYLQPADNRGRPFLSRLCRANQRVIGSHIGV